MKTIATLFLLLFEITPFSVEAEDTTLPLCTPDNVAEGQCVFNTSNNNFNNNTHLRIYSRKGARECTQNIEPPDSEKIHPPHWGTGWCTANLTAEKDPRTMQTLWSDIFSPRELKPMRDAKPGSEEFKQALLELLAKVDTMVNDGRKDKKVWDQIGTRMLEMQEECLQWAKNNPAGHSCSIAKHQSGKAWGYNSTKEFVSTMQFTHPQAGANAKQSSTDGSKHIQHFVVDTHKPLNLSGSNIKNVKQHGKRCDFNAEYVKDLNLSHSKLGGVCFDLGKVDKINLNGAKLYVTRTEQDQPIYPTIRSFREDDGWSNQEDPILMDVTESATFENMTANELRMRQANFVDNNNKVTFKGAKLRNAKLSGMNKKHWKKYAQRYKEEPNKYKQKFDFTEADLTKANMSGSLFYNQAIFKKAILFGTILEGIRADEANFQQANLRFAKLNGAILQGSDFTGADLRYADVTGADLRNTNFKNTDIRGMKGLDTADITGADFSSAKCYPEQYLILLNRNAGTCDVQDRCRYIGSLTIIKMRDKQQCGTKESRADGADYCYTVIRCSGKDIPPVDFRAFCPTKEGKCPSAESCAAADKSAEYVGFETKEKAMAGDGSGDSTEGGGGDDGGTGIR